MSIISTTYSPLPISSFLAQNIGVDDSKGMLFNNTKADQTVHAHWQRWAQTLQISLASLRRTWRLSMKPSQTSSARRDAHLGSQVVITSVSGGRIRDEATGNMTRVVSQATSNPGFKSLPVAFGGRHSLGLIAGKSGQPLASSKSKSSPHRYAGQLIQDPFLVSPITTPSQPYRAKDTRRLAF
ncbi:Uu.00g139770.m01.CDS01 [Anthostomella pinea]|uniref:Uu.00g139770.m01.CDS01 n=1 Tax=Anthostomella pinea TaxID=933095 RepID=A0AAI8VPX3_9PEZI|nr:Uu.00g139770.m01.CDS01 [Anthostomella pinea]